MTWRLEHEGPIPVLTNGNYAIPLTSDLLEELRTTKTLGDLEKALMEIAGRQRDPKHGRDLLRAAFGSASVPVREQLRAIWNAISARPLLDVRGLSDGALKKLHDAVRDALTEDDSLPPGGKKFFVRTFSDWKETAELLEGEMDARGMDYDELDF